jgi:two-component sensor histidine kinase
VRNSKLSESLVRQRRAAATGTQALRALLEAQARIAAIAQTRDDCWSRIDPMITTARASRRP